MVARDEEVLQGEDADRPTFHITAPRGWLSDPNGPCYYNGMYHMFYQYQPASCAWDWGLKWGHVVSKDLVHWEHVAPALEPTPGALDADACFSGCFAVDEDGVPTILYTGARLRSNPACGPLPPAEHDLGLPFIETQMLAVADPKDAKLLTWRKERTPLIPLPPTSNLGAWRDPFVIQRGGNGQDWVVIMAAGISKTDGPGTTLVYRAKRLRGEWEYVGHLCDDPSIKCLVWECPLLTLLPPLPVKRGKENRGFGWWDCDDEDQDDDVHVFSRISDMPLLTHDGGSALSKGLVRVNGCQPQLSTSRSYFFCVSPDHPPVHHPPIYWTGHYDKAAMKFDLANAVGPFRLDLGECVYAPNIMEDSHGRKILWCWVQETRRRLGHYDYSGCLATPRVMLRRDDGRIVQQPLPELAKIRRRGVRRQDLVIPQQVRMPLSGVSGRSLDMELTIQRHTSLITGLILGSCNCSSGEGAAAVLFDWESHRLEVIFEGLDPETLQPNLLSLATTRVGGEVLHEHGDTLHLRVLLDHSLLEVFTGNGQVLTTRVWRGAAPEGQHVCDPRAGAGIDFVSLGGDAVVQRLAVWEMDTIWRPQGAEVSQARLEAEAALDSIINKANVLLCKTPTPANSPAFHFRGPCHGQFESEPDASPTALATVQESPNALASDPGSTLAAEMVVAPSECVVLAA